MCIWLVQGKAPTSFLMLVVDIVEVDHVHLQSDTRAVWKKEDDMADFSSRKGTADGAGGQHAGCSQPVWSKQEVNP